jgi:hypothetical protein
MSVCVPACIHYALSAGTEKRDKFSDGVFLRVRVPRAIHPNKVENWVSTSDVTLDIYFLPIRGRRAHDVDHENAYAFTCLDAQRTNVRKYEGANEQFANTSVFCRRER